MYIPHTLYVKEKLVVYMIFILMIKAEFVQTQMIQEPEALTPMQ